MDLQTVRMRVHIAMGMVNNIKGNFKDKYRKRNTSITCPSCKPENGSNTDDLITEKPQDTQNHLLETCVAFKELRESIDTNTDSGLVSFFREVVKRRIEAELNE